MDKKIFLLLLFCISTISILCLFFISTIELGSSSGANYEQTDKDGRPNFIFILTDDQDSILNSIFAMKKVQSLVRDKGASFENSFVASPLCCPSRSSILTGQYVHNHKAINNSVTGGCSSYAWQNGPEKRSFVTHLHRFDYRTFFAGKYLNQYGKNQVGGLRHIPPGWDWWTGLRGNSVYYNYILSVNGSEERHDDNPELDYLTNVIRNKSLQFLNSDTFQTQPFFMMLSTPACHAPFDYEPKYAKEFAKIKAPRIPNFNVVNDYTKHWLLRLGKQPLAPKLIEKIDDIYRKRLRSLLTVDDMIEDVIKSLHSKGILNNTYIIFTSDNGYHLGQFSLPLDKREPYEFDIRVPLFIRGPRISSQVIPHLVTNIDIAPTILDLAGISIPSYFDGQSFKDHLFESFISKKEKYVQPEQTGSNFFHLTDSGRTVLVEHSGEGHSVNNGCEYLGKDLFGCNPDFSCKCSDSKNNTYSCLRSKNSFDDILYCRWEDNEAMEEFYDLKSDPYQLYNSVYNLSDNSRRHYARTLKKLSKCRGMNCDII